MFFYGKRLVKTPTIYFLDTGLASYLLGWDNAQVLQNGAMAGADRDGNEIDLLINRSGMLYPIEIMKHIQCDKSDAAAFKQLEKIPDIERDEGCVVCMASDVFPIAATDRAVGVRYL